MPQRKKLSLSLRRQSCTRTNQRIISFLRFRNPTYFLWHYITQSNENHSLLLASQGSVQHLPVKGSIAIQVGGNTQPIRSDKDLTDLRYPCWQDVGQVACEAFPPSESQLRTRSCYTSPGKLAGRMRAAGNSAPPYPSIPGQSCYLQWTCSQRKPGAHPSLPHCNSRCSFPEYEYTNPGVQGRPRAAPLATAPGDEWIARMHLWMGLVCD